MECATPQREVTLYDAYNRLDIALTKSGKILGITKLLHDILDTNVEADQKQPPQEMDSCPEPTKPNVQLRPDLAKMASALNQTLDEIEASLNLLTGKFR